MSRLTNNNKKHPILKDVGHANCKNVCEHEMFCDMCPIQEAIDKLAHYEDLEEEGRLIELPCKPDEWVWEAHEFYPTQLTRYYSNAHIVESMESGYCIGYTKAEAEAKLAELKEGEDDGTLDIM